MVDDEELLELVEMEVQELLASYEFDEDSPIVRVALKALEGDEAYGDSVMELMAAVDDYFEEPDRDLDKPFLMPIEDVFSITGRGTVVTGRIEQGVVNVGETVAIVGISDTSETTVTGVEMFRKLLDQGQAGDNVGVLLRGTKKDEVERGQVLAKPGSITPHTKFEAQVYVLSKDQGGRHTPFFDNYRPQFYSATDVTGAVDLPDGVEMVMPGDNTEMSVELIAPIAMDEGLRFAIREGVARLGPAASSRSSSDTRACGRTARGRRGAWSSGPWGPSGPLEPLLTPHRPPRPAPTRRTTRQPGPMFALVRECARASDTNRTMSHLPGGT